MSKPKWDFRDISVGMRMLREFLLGRKHELQNLHGRFGPRLAPRSIPPPDIPRGPFYHYSDQYYCKRNVMDSVKMPVVAPYGVAKVGAESVSPLSFKCAPTPGSAWWWDGHCYFDLQPVPKAPKPELPPCPPLKRPAPALEPKKPKRSHCEDVCAKAKK